MTQAYHPPSVRRPTLFDPFTPLQVVMLALVFIPLVALIVFNVDVVATLKEVL